MMLGSKSNTAKSNSAKGGGAVGGLGHCVLVCTQSCVLSPRIDSHLPPFDNAAYMRRSRQILHDGDTMPKPASPKSPPHPKQKPSPLLDTRVIYCGDNLDQLQKLPDHAIDLIYIDPPFNSNRNYEVF